MYYTDIFVDPEAGGVNLNSYLCSGIHTCFVCKKRSEDVRRCMIPVCGKFYHGECIASYAPTAPVNRGFRCSIHVCLTCFIANPNSSSISKGKHSQTPRLSAWCSDCMTFSCICVCVRRSSSTVCALPSSLSRYRPLHGCRQHCALQQQHRLSQSFHSPSWREEPWTRQCQLVLRLHWRYQKWFYYFAFTKGSSNN